MQAFYADVGQSWLPPGHRFPIEKYALLRERLASELPELRRMPAEPVSPGELSLVHSPAYVAAVVDGSLSQQQIREIGFPWSRAMVERALRSCGATLAACKVSLTEGLSANLAGGTHHAQAGKGSGFCVFNDVAVAARVMQMLWARNKRSSLRVAIVDLDVHQGNGTAEIFQHDDSVFTLSLHGARNFPFRKVTSDLDVDLPDGCEDKAYLEALEAALMELGRRFDPGFIIYIAGADPLADDRLGRLALTPAGLQARDHRVFDWAWERGVPLAITMGGGYGRDIRATVQVQINTFRLACDAWQRWQNRAQ